MQAIECLRLLEVAILAGALVAVAANYPVQWFACFVRWSAGLSCQREDPPGIAVIVVGSFERFLADWRTF
jgi:hypothetical protein